MIIVGHRCLDPPLFRLFYEDDRATAAGVAARIQNNKKLIIMFSSLLSYFWGGDSFFNSLQPPIQEVTGRLCLFVVKN